MTNFEDIITPELAVSWYISIFVIILYIGRE